MVVEALEGVHPLQLVKEGRSEGFVAKMAESLTAFANAFAPGPITYRTIDFRTNEFRGLRGGEDFEPQEANPMIGYRGALRYMQQPELLGLELCPGGKERMRKLTTASRSTRSKRPTTSSATSAKAWSRSA
jgi:pyruvate, water dikinase